MKIFYCAKCDKFESDFKISEQELRIRQTWLNLRDGYGGAITHMICPECGYVLSGFINWHKKVDDEIINYVKSDIELYSTREDSMLKEGMLDFIIKHEISYKQNKYNDCDDKNILSIINSMSTMPEHKKSVDCIYSSGYMCKINSDEECSDCSQYSIFLGITRTRIASEEMINNILHGEY